MVVRYAKATLFGQYGSINLLRRRFYLPLGDGMKAPSLIDWLGGWTFPTILTNRTSPDTVVSAFWSFNFPLLVCQAQPVMLLRSPSPSRGRGVSLFLCVLLAVRAATTNIALTIDACTNESYTWLQRGEPHIFFLPLVITY
jgi:hypothetical protein